MSHADPTATRAAGVLLHATALPGGTLAGAPRFIDWLARAGQSWWQLLPLGPPDSFGSPYAGASAFAGWPGLLARPAAKVSEGERDDLRAQCAFWIDDWERWAGPGALDDQVRFTREWAGLRDYAAERGVRLLGDVPFYVAADSADHRAHPELFLADVVGGVPPDDFSADGQLWGNPPYDWAASSADGHEWWVQRLRRLAQLVDAARIDHFRGFAAWWAVPAGASTAIGGEWRPGPGAALFERVAAEVPQLGLIAEDLGVITSDVVELRERLGLPGMRVLQYAFNDDAGNPHRLEHHPQRALVVTGTHDNDTITGWWRVQPEQVQRRALAQAATWGVHEAEPHRALVRLALASPAGLAIVPVQDLLALGSEARFNTPGVAAGNWSWRVDGAQLDPALADWLREATDDAGRLIGPH